MFSIYDWVDITLEALGELWKGFLGLVPRLIGAVLIFIIGWFISVGIGKLVTAVLKAIKFNRLFEKGNLKTALEKAEIKVDASGFVGVVFKWIFVIVFLLAAVEVLGFVQFADFLTDVLRYLPNVVVAVLIFVVAVIIADIAEKVVRTAVEGTKVGYGQVAGAIVRWSIWVFAILMILSQLGIAETFMKDLFRGIVAMIVITVGLSFGLGGKDIAASILQKVKGKLEQ